MWLIAITGGLLSAMFASALVEIRLLRADNVALRAVNARPETMLAAGQTLRDTVEGLLSCYPEQEADHVSRD